MWPFKKKPVIIGTGKFNMDGLHNGAWELFRNPVGMWRFTRIKEQATILGVDTGGLVKNWVLMILINTHLENQTFYN